MSERSRPAALFVRRFGDPTAPPVVVIHGGPSWDHSYLLPALSSLNAVLFDLRGCGRSERGLDVQPESLADDVAALISSLGLASADVLGFSFGGRIAMRLVERHPALVRRLVLASTTAYTEFDLSEVPEYAARSAMCSPLPTELPAEDGAWSRAMAFAGVPLQIWRLDRRAEWERVLAGVRFSSDYDEPFRAGTLRPGAPAEAEAVLRSWGGPVLIVHGTHDLCFPVSVARRLHAALPSSTLAEIPDAGHMTHFDSEQAWFAAVSAFLIEPLASADADRGA